MSELLIKSNILEVSREEVYDLSEIEGALQELYRLEKDLLLDIIEYLETVKLTREEEEALRRPITTDVEALFSLFKAIDQSDRRNYNEAAKFYEKALKEDPGLVTAKTALDELYNLDLITTQKKSRSLLRSLRDRTSLTDRLTPEDPNKRIRTPNENPTTGDVTISW